MYLAVCAFKTHWCLMSLQIMTSLWAKLKNLRFSVKDVEDISLSCGCQQVGMLSVTYFINGKMKSSLARWLSS